MSHSWSAEVRATGLIDASDESIALTVRNAHLALEATVATSEDAALWASLISSANAILTAIDPTHTGDVYLRLAGAGLHAGYAAASCGIDLSFSQSGGQMSDPHHLTFHAPRVLAAPDVLLARTYLESVIQARGHTFTSEDSLVFDAMTQAAQTLTQLLAPGVSGVVNIGGSALVNPGLDAVQVSLQVSSTQPEAAAPSAGLPAGSIVAYRGVSIPSGWLLCDGTNGTPDLRGRFIIGDTAPGLGAAAGTSDPAAALTHAVSQPADHTVTQPAAHTVTQPSAHTNHVVTQPAGHATAATGTTGSGLRFSNAAAATHTGTAVDAHSAHAGTGVSAHAGTGVSTHTGAAVSAHPALAHYRLVYIIKE